MQVKDLTTDELKALIRETVAEILEEFLDYPDRGKEIQEKVKQRLLQSLKETEAGVRGVPMEEVAKSG